MTETYQNSCRACMSKEDSRHGIFDSNIKPIAISQMLGLISHLNIVPNDGLPESICSSCFNSLLGAYEFQQMCIVSDTEMRTTLSSSEPKTVHEADECTEEQAEYVLSDVNNDDNKDEIDLKDETFADEICLDAEMQIDDVKEEISSDDEALLRPPKRDSVQDSCSAAKRRRHKWTYAETKAMLESYKARVEEFKHPTKKKNAWKNVLKDLVAQNVLVFPVSEDILAMKLRNLMRPYKSAKDTQNNRTGVGCQQVPFGAELDDIFGNSPIISTSGAANLRGGPLAPLRGGRERLSSLAASSRASFADVPAAVPAVLPPAMRVALPAASPATTLSLPPSSPVPSTSVSAGPSTSLAVVSRANTPLNKNETKPLSLYEKEKLKLLRKRDAALAGYLAVKEQRHKEKMDLLANLTANLNERMKPP